DADPDLRLSLMVNERFIHAFTQRWIEHLPTFRSGSDSLKFDEGERQWARGSVTCLRPFRQVWHSRIGVGYVPPNEETEEMWGNHSRTFEPNVLLLAELQLLDRLHTQMTDLA